VGKDKYKVTNWSSYNEGLKQRGSITLWIQSEQRISWRYTAAKKRGGQILYSDSAIELSYIIRKLYHLPLRQTEGFISSLFKQMSWELPVPDYTTICKRGKKLNVSLSIKAKPGITDIVIDSTGLKVYGEGEWKVRKHGAGKHRTWMKMHIAANEETQQIEAVTLTTNSIDDATEVNPLLKQIDKPIGSAKADGAYDKSKARKVLNERKIKQVIPPQHNAVISIKKQPYLRSRNKAIKEIKSIGRDEWKKKSNYHQRSKAETVMYRYKTIIGNNLSSRKPETQKTEVRIGCKILNVLLQVAKPVSIKVA
jgi:IS5 family transposase